MTNREIIAEAAKVLGTEAKNLSTGTKKNGKTVFINRYDLVDYPNGKEVAKYEPSTGKLVVL